MLSHGDHDEEFAVPIERDGDRFSAVVRPHDVRTVAGHVPLAEGPWDLYARIRASGPAVRVKLDRALLADLPTVRRAGRRDVMVRDVEFDSLAIVVPPRAAGQRDEARRPATPADRGVPRRSCGCRDATWCSSTPTRSVPTATTPAPCTRS